MDDIFNTTLKEIFQEPQKKFWPKSRKRPKSDALSISSIDISMESNENKKKKRRRITEVASNIFSSNAVSSKIENSLRKSFSIHSTSSNLSFVNDEANTGTLKKKQKTSFTETTSFTLRSWLLDVAKINTKDYINNTLSQSEVKRQEAIYELYCGENVLLNELYRLKSFYYTPLLSSGIFTSDELFILFGDIMHLIEIHNKLVNELINLRDQFGFTETVGPTILNWLPTLKEPYLERCKTQVWARHLLEEKKLNNKRFQTFLKKRLESSHSVDLWTYLDVPRSRIVKYPLLVKEILRHTPPKHIDEKPLKEANEMLSDLLKNIDNIMGIAECELAQSKINVKLENDPTKTIENATELIIKGLLKDVKGTKFHCFLFDTCFAITRSTRRPNKKYNLSFPVIPKDQIHLSIDNNGYGFKVGNHFLMAEDKHNKRHWIDSFNKIDQSNIATSAILHNNNRESNVNSVVRKSNQVSLRKSLSNISEHNYPSTLKKNSAKQKRNSIGYI